MSSKTEPTPIFEEVIRTTHIDPRLVNAKARRITFPIFYPQIPRRA